MITDGNPLLIGPTFGQNMCLVDIPTESKQNPQMANFRDRNVRHLGVQDTVKVTSYQYLFYCFVNSEALLPYLNVSQKAISERYTSFFEYWSEAWVS
jgi:hypothetical protein